MEHLAESSWERSHVTNVSPLLIEPLLGVYPVVWTHSQFAELEALVTFRLFV